ncbi:MAG TPA: OmpA family protein [Acetobacteraceae bacterium]|nr:OmpA family protein [Acetobacteraceae bacterium]
MRIALSVLLLMTAASPALAQATVDTQALEHLNATPHHAPVHHPTHRRPVRTSRRHEYHPATHPAHEAEKAKPAPAAEAHAPPPKPATPPLPTVPAAAPPPPVIPPPLVVPTRPTPPPPAIPVVDSAQGKATTLPSGVQITFGEGSSNLNKATEAAIRAYGLGMRENPNSRVDVIATAAGTPDDPSTPRRLALERALAARAVLIHEGIPSTRIYVKAMGTDGIGTGPADRVDLLPSGGHAAASPAAGPASAQNASGQNASGQNASGQNASGQNVAAGGANATPPAPAIGAAAATPPASGASP